MNKTEKYQVHARKGIFYLEVSEDAEMNGYLGKFGPILPFNQAGPGHPDYSGAPKPGERRHQNKDKVMELCTESISELAGTITVCRLAPEKLSLGGVD